MRDLADVGGVGYKRKEAWSTAENGVDAGQKAAKKVSKETTPASHRSEPQAPAPQVENDIGVEGEAPLDFPEDPLADALQNNDITTSGEGGDELEGNVFAEAMQSLLEEVKSKSESEWPSAWTKRVPRAADAAAALGSLFETVMLEDAEQGMDLAARMTVELAKELAIKVEPIGEALEGIASRLGNLLEGHETAWYLISDVLVLMFPKSSSAQWGLLVRAWNWNVWWKMVSEVLGKTETLTGAYRAYDIMVRILSSLQERCGGVVKEQQVWKDGGRIVKVRKALCEWGEMDEDTLTDTLQAYGVEL